MLPGRLRELGGAPSGSGSAIDLGGLVLKQAICIANEQLYRYESLVYSILGIIFLSTPHLSSTPIETLQATYNILRASGIKVPKPSADYAADESTIISNLAKRFESLVGKLLCTTHAPLEQFLAVPSGHADVCRLGDDHNDSLPAMISFVTSAWQYAERTITARLEASPELSMTNSSAVNTEGSSKTDFIKVPSSTGATSSRREPKLPCMALDAYDRNKDFFGREDVLDLIGQALLPQKEKMLSSENDGLRQFALCGFGGLGKTEIALEFAHRHKHKFDAVFWVRADASSKLNQTYCDLSVRLGLEEPSDSKNYTVSREVLKGWLSDPWKPAAGQDEAFKAAAPSSAQATWLLIFDNADDPYVLTDFWPQGSGSVLITSRDPLAKVAFSTAPSGIDLHPLREQEGATLLKKMTHGTENADAAARNISNSVGGLPLALAQIASIVMRQDLTLEEMWVLYSDRSEHSSLHGLNFKPNTPQYPHSIATVWAFERLRPAARAFLDVLAFLDPDRIQEDLFAESISDEMLPDFPTAGSSYREARTDLLQSSLVKRNKESFELTMHRLVQDAARAKLGTRKFNAIFSLIVHLIWSNWPSAMPKAFLQSADLQPKITNQRLVVGRWPRCAALYPHVLRLKDLWQLTHHIPPVVKMKFAALLNDAAWYQNERGRTRDPDGFFEASLDICENSGHPNKDALLIDIHFCLGAIAADSNRHTASREHKETSFAIQTKAYEELERVDERLAMNYAELAISRVQDGRYDEGVAAFLRQQEISKSLGNYIPQSREANLGLAYMMQGKLLESETILVQSIEARQKALGKEDKESFRTGKLIYALGNLRALQGRLDESYDCHVDAWNRFLATVGNQDHRTADVGHKIAEHYLRRCQYDDALTITNDILKVWKRDPEAYTPEIARTSFLKSTIQEKLGLVEQAAKTRSEACRLRRQWLGDAAAGDGDDSLQPKDFDGLVTFWSR
ncbi:MAG: hypothetical protein Q9186_001128 [Xanthomendoza sp. 1 TL-2023]